jgi:hypothetical protein
VKSAKFPAFFGTHDDCHLISRPTIGRNRNFGLFVAKKRKAKFRLITDSHNMVTGKELGTGHVDPTTTLPSGGNIIRIAGHKVGLPVCIVTRLCGAIESQVPIGYEDEGGFHYGANLADWFFSI